MIEAMLCKCETQNAFLLQHVLWKLLNLVNPATASDDQDYECQSHSEQHILKETSQNTYPKKEMVIRDRDSVLISGQLTEQLHWCFLSFVRKRQPCRFLPWHLTLPYIWLLLKKKVCLNNSDSMSCSTYTSSFAWHTHISFSFPCSWESVH